MKKIFILLMVAMCATMFTACSKDDDTDPSDAGEGVITMTTDDVADDGEFRINTAKAGDIITIDWGDGNTEEFRSVKGTDEDQPDGIGYIINPDHTYQIDKVYTIKVTGAMIGFNTLDPFGLTSLDVSKCTALTSLSCNGNKLTTLDVSKNTKLTGLSCGDNKLTTLDVSKNTALTHLYCDDNKLTTLDVSKNTKLTSLYCGSNKLTTLDVSKNTALTRFLECYSNNFSATALNKIFTDLPQAKTVDDWPSRITIYDNPGSETCNKSIAENKGWNVYNQ